MLISWQTHQPERAVRARHTLHLGLHAVQRQALQGTGGHPSRAPALKAQVSAQPLTGCDAACGGAHLWPLHGQLVRPWQVRPRLERLGRRAPVPAHAVAALLKELVVLNRGVNSVVPLVRPPGVLDLRLRMPTCASSYSCFYHQRAATRTHRCAGRARCRWHVGPGTLPRLQTHTRPQFCKCGSWSSSCGGRLCSSCQAGGGGWARSCLRSSGGPGAPARCTRTLLQAPCERSLRLITP